MTAIHDQFTSKLQELADHISSPLAAARYALYLAACRCHDDDAVQYLALADREISAITEALRCVAEPAEPAKLQLVSRPLAA